MTEKEFFDKAVKKAQEVAKTIDPDFHVVTFFEKRSQGDRYVLQFSFKKDPKKVLNLVPYMQEQDYIDNELAGAVNSMYTQLKNK